MLGAACFRLGAAGCVLLLPRRHTLVLLRLVMYAVVARRPGLVLSVDLSPAYAPPPVLPPALLFPGAVQFSIRSFVVPELTVHLPEDATVGTLKVCHEGPRVSK